MGATASPGAPGRRDRGSDHRAVCLRGRSVRRARARQGARRAVQGVRRRSPADRARLRDPDGDRLPARRARSSLVLASLRPALRATRVPPIAAVREGSVLPPSRFASLVPPSRSSVCVVALALVSFGAFGHGIATGPRLVMLAVGVLGLFVGVAIVAPSIVRPLASSSRWPATRIGGVAGSLARSNSMRNPGRTASTAAALMIGLALVTIVAVLAQGLAQPRSRARSRASSTRTMR